MLGYDKSVTPPPYDPAGAKALLAKSGNANLSLTLNAYNATSTIPDVNKLTETVASLWKEIGVTATLNMADSGTILPAWRAKQLHGAGIIGGPVYFYYEPSRLTLSFFSSLAPYTTVTDPTLDALSDKINQTVDKAERTKLGKQLSDLLSQQLWGEGLVTVSSLALFGPNVANWTTIKGCPYANVSWLRST
jgi:ABC-type transport system substrate-binding protein